MTTPPAGIGCFKGCGNPVVGQCQGYKDTCGSFYCSTDSKGKLCSDCADKKAHDEYIEATILEYQKLAEDVDKKGLPTWTFIVMLVAFGPGCWLTSLSVTMRFFSQPGPAVLLALIPAFLMMSLSFWMYTNSNSIKNAELAKLSDEKLHFAEFFQEWKKHKNAETLAATHNFIMVVGGAVDSYNREQTRKEVHKAAQKINRS